MVSSDICKSELQTLQLKFGESTRLRNILERDIERKSEDYNHVLEQLNQSLIQKKDLEQKNQSIISSETKDVLEMEILQLKQNFQESTEKYKTLNEKLIDSLKQINFLEVENKRLTWNMNSIKVARKLSDDVFTKANTLGTGKIDTNYRPGIGRESFENELAKQEKRTNCENSESTLPDLFTSINEEDSDDETVINCSPDDTVLSISKKSIEKIVKSETNLASSSTNLNKPKVFEKQPKKPVKPYFIPQKQVSKQKPKLFQKPFENRFQDITFNNSRNFQKPSHQKVPNHHHQKDFQNHYPRPRYEEQFSNKSSNPGYLSPNHRSNQPTGFQRQITFWVNMINQIKPFHLHKPNSYNRVKSHTTRQSLSKGPKITTTNKQGPIRIWVPKSSV
jgi:hypothetical protein